MTDKMRTIRAAITVFYEGRFVAPGTEITLPEAEANDHESRFGVIENGSTLSLSDLNSLEQLNNFHAIFND